jgi:hypothetical protein
VNKVCTFGTDSMTDEYDPELDEPDVFRLESPRKRLGPPLRHRRPLKKQRGDSFLQVSRDIESLPKSYVLFMDVPAIDRLVEGCPDRKTFENLAALLDSQKAFDTVVTFRLTMAKLKADGEAALAEVKAHEAKQTRAEAGSEEAQLQFWLARHALERATAIRDQMFEAQKPIIGLNVDIEMPVLTAMAEAAVAARSSATAVASVPVSGMNSETQ